MHWLIRSSDSKFWYDCCLDSMPHFHFNHAVVSMVPMSFFWQGVVLDRGRLLSVLPTLIVEQISLIFISVVGLCLGMGIFLWRVLGSLFRDLEFKMRFSLIFGNHVFLLRFLLVTVVVAWFLGHDDALSLRGFCMVS